MKLILFSTLVPKLRSMADSQKLLFAKLSSDVLDEIAFFFFFSFSSITPPLTKGFFLGIIACIFFSFFNFSGASGIKSYY